MDAPGVVGRGIPEEEIHEAIREDQGVPDLDPSPALEESLYRLCKAHQREEQLADLEATINATDCDAVVIGTPIDLGRLLTFNVPTTRVKYELQEIGQPNLEQLLAKFMD